MIKTVFASLAFTVSAAHAAPLAAVDNSFNCDNTINNLISGANMTATGGFDPILTVENGRAKINKESKRIKSFKTDAKYVFVTFKKDIIVNGKTDTVEETVKYEVNDQGYIINYENDRAGVRKYDPMRRFGTKARLSKLSDGNCAIDQFSNVVGTPDGSTAEVVIQDKKFCDSVKDVISQMNQKTFSQCNSLLDKAAEAYEARAKELGKESKKLAILGEAPTSTIALTLQALNMCAPDEWYDKAMSPMGMMRTLKAVPVEAAKNTSGSKKKGVNN
ncbi:hypothetical protein DOM22_06325 [Bdellovibrio sp. ZAP7]|uniref:hypothetical protein n=1 Tax=Bdellovibrio sp. ZAP7 TaxID=2231053 RepID=UPI00115B6CB7|nr:hypothetical protein [Bdellovibrio sp. ZAP7]QDK44805.1 hypothetical protein DOM22_06325 [Bdellovibrio sp. ZAP7]